MEKNFKNKRQNSTNKLVKDFLPKILKEVEKKYLNNSQLVINYWPEVIGKKLFKMTRINSFENGILYVLVKSSTLFSILSMYEKDKLLKRMQNKFSKEVIKNIVFKME